MRVPSDRFKKHLKIFSDETLQVRIKPPGRVSGKNYIPGYNLIPFPSPYKEEGCRKTG
ncbi:MAG TPA: hypothetical protein PLD12_08925 [Bacteroidales bacterium]|nr:hypothetical protein [Bacteroidales bacterium]HOK99248.1 hypothetical protein [Bacteroidales bacterium]HPO66153.1 hypothetical protein [Bacteroidales bacterium]